MLASAAVLIILLSLLFPAVRLASAKAREASCVSNLRMLQVAHQLYLGDNRQQFIPYYGSVLWMSMLIPYHTSGSNEKRDRLRFCPNATTFAGASPSTCDWYYSPDGSWGSYGMNGYMYSPFWAQDMPGNDWLVGGRYCPRLGMDQLRKKWIGSTARAATNTPLFLDCQWVDLWPREDLALPDNRVNVSIYGLSDPDSAGSMVRSSITRHEQGICIVFVDGHAGRIPINGLKKLKWSMDWQNGN